MLDRFIIEFDKVLNTLFAKPWANREDPSSSIPETILDDTDKKKSISLMRINHCGEVCAQALYQGQRLATKKYKDVFFDSAQEEQDHLAWTYNRINELNGKTSVFTPLFYLGSLTLGFGAGLLSDKLSFSFLEETEYQVLKHLDKHLNILPTKDQKSRAILLQMKLDETSHANTAKSYGAVSLPQPLKLGMNLAAKIMTSSTYYI